MTANRPNPVSVARQEAARQLYYVEQAFCDKADHPQARDDAADVMDLAEMVAKDVAKWKEALRRIDPTFILTGGGKFTTADGHDWAELITEFITQPMQPEAARLFAAAVKREAI